MKEKIRENNSSKSKKKGWLIGGLIFLLSSLLPLIIFFFLLSNSLCSASSASFPFAKCTGFLAGILLGKFTLFLPIIFVLGTIIGSFVYNEDDKYSFGKIFLWGILLNSFLFYLFVYQKLMSIPPSI